MTRGAALVADLDRRLGELRDAAALAGLVDGPATLTRAQSRLLDELRDAERLLDAEELPAEAARGRGRQFDAARGRLAALARHARDAAEKLRGRLIDAGVRP